MSRGDRRVVDLVERLGLVPHPEGGYYREVWRSPLVLPGAALPTGQGRDRRLMTSIYYLLPQGERSRLHRVRSEELWLHHQGDDLLLGVGATREAAAERERFLRLGPGADATFQAIVPAGHWQQAEPAPGAHGYVLVGCVVAPGFEFEDFELAQDD